MTKPGQSTNSKSYRMLKLHIWLPRIEIRNQPNPQCIDMKSGISQTHDHSESDMAFFWLRSRFRGLSTAHVPYWRKIPTPAGLHETKNRHRRIHCSAFRQHRVDTAWDKHSVFLLAHVSAFLLVIRKSNTTASSASGSQIIVR